MAKLLPSLCLAVVLALPAWAEPARVRRVVDGDTLLLTDGRRLRLIGVDTPEHHPSAKLQRDAKRTGRDAATLQALGKRSTDFVRALIDGREVRLEYDPVNRARRHKDRYGRTLAYVYFTPPDCGELEVWVADEVCESESFDEGFLNALILVAGYGSAYTQAPFRHLDDFRQHERNARESERGLWRPAPKRARLNLSPQPS